MRIRKGKRRTDGSKELIRKTRRTLQTGKPRRSKLNKDREKEHCLHKTRQSQDKAKEDPIQKRTSPMDKKKEKKKKKGWKTILSSNAYNAHVAHCSWRPLSLIPRGVSQVNRLFNISRAP